MKFKDRYQCARCRDYSIGPFYRSDLRKISSLQQHYRFLFPDSISHDPMRYMGKVLELETSLFYTVRNKKKVEGYGLTIMTDSTGVVEFHTMRKKIPFSLLKARRFLNTQLEFIFEELSMRKIYTRCPIDLTTMTSLLRRMGFKVEGILRKDSIFDEKLRDMVVFGMLREEF